MAKSYFLFILLCVFTFLTDTAFSQEFIKEVSLVYDISLHTAKNNSPLKSFEGATLTVFVKGNLSRTEMSSLLGVESNIYNNNTRIGFILKEYSGQKLMITLTESNWQNRNRFFSDIFFEATNEEKIINGYKCKSARVLSKNSNVDDVYYLYDLKINNNNYYHCFSNLPGIPVKYSIKKEDKVFIYTLKKMNYDNVMSSIFDEPISGYRKITYEEALKVKGDEK